MSRTRKILLVLILITLGAAAGVGYFAYKMVYGPTVKGPEAHEFYLYPETGHDELLSQLKNSGALKHPSYLNFVAGQMSFEESRLKPGRYDLKPGMSTFELLDLIRLGKQSPLNLTLHGFRKSDELAGFLGKKLMYDSLHYADAIAVGNDSTLCKYLPDTYEFYWSTDGQQFNERMASYHHQYWENKETTILGLKLTPCEIYILASIVEKETTYDPEKPDIAGVYINRLNRGIPLQADPTVVYSIGDFSIRRVLTSYLSFESPYNTYLNAGLPPGPICMPSKASLEAVVNASNHDYLYFCARPDNSGKHAFAETLAQHNRNARAFQRWMNQQGIKR